MIPWRRSWIRSRGSGRSSQRQRGPRCQTSGSSRTGVISPRVLGWCRLQASSGQTIRLGKMSKRGNPYLRKLLIQGAHAVLNTVGRKDDAHSRWLQELVRRRGRCKAAVALANKNARIMYVIMAGKAERFSPDAAHQVQSKRKTRLRCRAWGSWPGGCHYGGVTSFEVLPR